MATKKDKRDEGFSIFNDPTAGKVQWNKPTKKQKEAIEALKKIEASGKKKNK